MKYLTPLFLLAACNGSPGDDDTSTPSTEAGHPTGSPSVGTPSGVPTGTTNTDPRSTWPAGPFLEFGLDGVNHYYEGLECVRGLDGNGGWAGKYNREGADLYLFRPAFITGVQESTVRYWLHPPPGDNYGDEIAWAYDCSMQLWVTEVVDGEERYNPDFPGYIERHTHDAEILLLAPCTLDEEAYPAGFSLQLDHFAQRCSVWSTEVP